MIVGLSLGSIVSMFCNGDVMEVYMTWAKGGATAGEIGLSLGLGAALFAAGVVIAYLLVRYERKKGATEEQSPETVDAADKEIRE